MRRRVNFALGASEEITAQVKAAAANADTQSFFSKYNEKQAKILGTAAAIVQVVPGIGQAVGVVLGVVGAASALVAKLFKKSKAKKLSAERKEWAKVNAQILEENKDLDGKITELGSAVQQVTFKLAEKSQQVNPKLANLSVKMTNRLNLATTRNFIAERSLTGLSFKLPKLSDVCLINCAKKSEEKALKATKEEYERLATEQSAKVSSIESLFDEFNIAVEQSKLIDQQILEKKQQQEIVKQKAAVASEKKNNILLWSGVTLASGVAIFLTVSKLKNRKRF